MLGHLGGSGGAVEADGVDAERFQHRQRCTALRPHEHDSGGLDGEVDENRQVDLARGGGTMSAYDCGASLQEVLAGLDLDAVGARVNHGLDDLLVDIADGGETNLTKGRQLGSRTDRSNDVTRLVRTLVSCLASQFRGSRCQFDSTWSDAVLRQGRQVHTEGVGLDDVSPGIQVGVMNAGDDIGSGDIEYLVAALKSLEVIYREIAALQHRAHGAINDENVPGQSGAKGHGFQPRGQASLGTMRFRHMDRPWVVVAFSGWNDAGSAATQAATLIAKYSEAKTWRTIGGEEFHDFRQTRPAITVMNDVEIVNWPCTTIRVGGWQGQPIVIVTGPEPSLRWRTYCFRLLRRLRKLKPAGLVVLGAMATDVAHTRQLPVMVSTTDPDLVSALGAEKLEYDGPTGIPFVLVTEARRHDFNAIGLWVGVPQYACESPCPPAVQSLLVRIEELTGIAVPQAGLEEDKREWVGAIDEALSEHPELAEYVAALETEQDATLPEGLTGDVLAVEFQSYLRHRGT